MVAARMPLARCAARRVSSADVVGGMGSLSAFAPRPSVAVAGPPFMPACIRKRLDGSVHPKSSRQGLRERKLLEHHETELCSPSHRFGPTIRIELGENGGDVKLGGVEGDSQPTCDGFVGDAVCHRGKYFELAGC
jgi:hypothetical protein